MMPNTYIACLILSLSCLNSQALQKADTTRILIANPTIQIETTQALNDLYNFKFDDAEKQFRWLREKYPWHPLPYFLLGLSTWWKIMPNTKNKTYDKAFMFHMNKAISVARNLYIKSPEYKIEASFFLAAAHGFKSRLYAEMSRKQWLSAASEGRAALKYLKISKTKKDLSPELLFGDGLYNYFSAWVPENYPSLKPLLWFLPKGNKSLGLAQLKEVSYNAFYARTEAMIWLMRILSGYENEHKKALQIAIYLHETYPENPYLHHYYVRILYNNSQFTKMEKQAQEIIQRIDNGQFGYDANSGRYAAYYLGKLYQMKDHMTAAKKYYSLMIVYAHDVDDTTSGYYLTSLLELGKIYQKEGNKELAINYFTKVKKKAKRKTSTFKEAKKKLAALKKR